MTGRASSSLSGVRSGIPTAEGASDTFSLDHLFIDTRGIPVIVEVKRSSDTRIRREVVGQMLDYAANGTRYWPISKLRESLDEIEGKHRVPRSRWDFTR